MTRSYQTIRAKKHGQARLREHAERKRIVRFTSLVSALQHAQKAGATLVRFVSLNNLTFTAYRPAPGFPGQWGQSAYCEVDSHFTNDRYWVLTQKAPGDEAESLAIILREEEQIIQAEVEAAALMGHSPAPRLKLAPRPAAQSSASLALQT